MAASKRTDLIQAMMPYDMIRLEFVSRRVIRESGKRLPTWRLLTTHNVSCHFLAVYLQKELVSLYLPYAID